MTSDPSKGFRRLLIVAAVVLVAIVSLSAQSDKSPQKEMPKDEKATMESLLSEVHQIRVTMGRLNNAQLLIDHIRIQYEHIDRINKELQGVRQQISESESLIPVLNQKIDQEQKKVDAGMAGPEQLNDIKAEVERQTNLQGDLRVREAQMSKELDQQRTILSDLNERLDKIERELEKQPQPDKLKGD